MTIFLVQYFGPKIFQYSQAQNSAGGKMFRLYTTNTLNTFVPTHAKSTPTLATDIHCINHNVPNLLAHANIWFAIRTRNHFCYFCPFWCLFFIIYPLYSSQSHGYFSHNLSMLSTVFSSMASLPLIFAAVNHIIKHFFCQWKSLVYIFNDLYGIWIIILLLNMNKLFW